MFLIEPRPPYGDYATFQSENDIYYEPFSTTGKSTLTEVP
jgi:hypothetical protein